MTYVQILYIFPFTPHMVHSSTVPFKHSSRLNSTSSAQLSVWIAYHKKDNNDGHIVDIGLTTARLVPLSSRCVESDLAVKKST
jgi:hypothetical protein